MTHHVNELGQPIGFAVENFIVPARPSFNRLPGNFVRVESISLDHPPSLHIAFSMDSKGALTVSLELI